MSLIKLKKKPNTLDMSMTVLVTPNGNLAVTYG